MKTMDSYSESAKRGQIVMKDIKNGVRVEYYLIDADHDGALVREETFTAESFAVCLDVKLYDTYLIKLKTL